MNSVIWGESSVVGTGAGVIGRKVESIEPIGTTVDDFGFQEVLLGRVERTCIRSSTLERASQYSTSEVGKDCEGHDGKKSAHFCDWHELETVLRVKKFLRLKIGLWKS